MMLSGKRDIYLLTNAGVFSKLFQWSTHVPPYWEDVPLRDVPIGGEGIDTSVLKIFH